MAIYPSSHVEGWLMKQRHGLRKSWLRRYFVLDGNELKYYKNAGDTVPHNTLQLDNYQVILTHGHSKRPFTFLLLSKNKTDRSYLLLQAETQQDLNIWVDALVHQQINESTSVLEKWLERLDIIPPPNTPSRVTSSSSSSLLLRPPLRGYRSSESITSTISSAESHSTAVTSLRSSFTEPRKGFPPSPPTNKKFFATLFHHWKSGRHPPPDEAPESAIPPPQQTTTFTCSAATPPPPPPPDTTPLIMPIVHPKDIALNEKPQRQRSASSSSSSHTPTQRHLSRGRSCSCLYKFSSSDFPQSFPRILTTPCLDL